MERRVVEKSGWASHWARKSLAILISAELAPCVWMAVRAWAMWWLLSGGLGSITRCIRFYNYKRE